MTWKKPTNEHLQCSDLLIQMQPGMPNYLLSLYIWKYYSLHKGLSSSAVQIIIIIRCCSTSKSWGCSLTCTFRTYRPPWFLHQALCSQWFPQRGCTVCPHWPGRSSSPQMFTDRTWGCAHMMICIIEENLHYSIQDRRKLIKSFCMFTCCICSSCSWNCAWTVWESKFWAKTSRLLQGLSKSLLKEDKLRRYLEREQSMNLIWQTNKVLLLQLSSRPSRVWRAIPTEWELGKIKWLWNSHRIFHSMREWLEEWTIQEIKRIFWAAGGSISTWYLRMSASLTERRAYFMASSKWALVMQGTGSASSSIKSASSACRRSLSMSRSIFSLHWKFNLEVQKWTSPRAVVAQRLHE